MKTKKNRDKKRHKKTETIKDMKRHRDKKDMKGHIETQVDLKGS